MLRFFMILGGVSIGLMFMLSGLLTLAANPLTWLLIAHLAS